MSETQVTPPTQLAAFALPVRDGRVLLARHTYAYTHLWGMVGGVAERGEPLDVTARREVREETGLVVCIDRLLALAHVGSLMMAVYDCEVTGGAERPQPDEIAELRWFTETEVRQDESVFSLVRSVAPALFASSEAGLRRAQVNWLEGPLVEVRLA